MSGWTLVPESPQAAPQPAQDAASAWTPVAESNAPTGAVAPQQSAMSDLVDMGKLGASLIYSRMLGADPQFAYQNYDEIDKGLSSFGDFKQRMGKAAVVKDDPLYMAMKHTGPEPFESQDMLENFVHDVSEFAGDPVIWGPALLGTLFGGPVGGRIGTTGGFALDAGLRKMLTDHYQKGTATSFGDLASRTAATLWAATKGGITGEAMGLAGKVPVPKAFSDMAANTLRGLYQSTAMTTVGSLLDWRVPHLEDFERNAVAVTGLGLIIHGATKTIPDSKQGLLDVYAKDGTTPQESATKLQAQPPVKPEQPEGLKPAIRITAKDGSKQVITGEPGETHSELAQRVTGEKPVTIDELEAAPKEPSVGQAVYINRDIKFSGFDPDKPVEKATYIGEASAAGFPDRYLLQRVDDEGNPAGKVAVVRHELGLTDKETAASFIGSGDGPKSSPINRVLSQPEIHEQSVIDRAWELKDDIDPTDEKYNKANLKSGRGFASTNGDYLNRMQARNWTKANEPDVYQMWLDGQGGNDKAEFHSQDYYEARNRVAQRTTLEGEPRLNGVSGELQEFLAKNREALNDIKAGNKDEGYGKSVIRTLFTGPRNMVRAQAEQVAGNISKLIPDYIDQEALSFMRDYRDDPNELRQEIENIRNGDNAKLQRAIPSMERALEPTPAMLQADKLMTDYFTQANSLRSQFVGADSSIDPSRYSPRNFMRVTEDADESGGVGRSKFAKRSPHDIRREYLRLLDPLKSGDVEARTFNSVDELRIYGDRLGTSVARNVLEMELKNSELGKHGIAGQVPAALKAQMSDTGILSNKELEELGGIPKNWVALQGTEKTIVSDGKQFRVGLQVPKPIAEAMRPILENDVISGAKYWKAAKYAQAYIKSIELGLSPFHMRALTLSFLNNEGIDAYRKALTTSNDSPEFEAQERIAAVEGGVTTTKTSTPYEAYQGLKPSSIEPRDTLLAKAKAAYAPVDAIFKGMTKATFEVVQRKFKVIGYSIRKASWLANNPNATDVEYGKAMRSIGKEINAVYGGLNWDVMGVSSNFQAIGRMFLLAPDWTFSNVANLKYAFEGGPGGNAARAFWIKSFATGLAMTQGMSLLLTGQMSKQWDKVYLGKDDKGKEMYSSMFFVGAPKDAIGTVNSTIRDGFPIGTVEFAINKASPLVGTGVKLAEKTDWQGKPIIKRGDTFGEKTEKGLAFTGEQLLPAPFVIKDMASRMLNPNEDLTYKDFLAGIIGAAVYHEGAKDGGVKVQGATSKRRGFRLSGAR